MAARPLFQARRASHLRPEPAAEGAARPSPPPPPLARAHEGPIWIRKPAEIRLKIRPMQFVDPHLRREIFGWHSPSLGGMYMPIVRYGHWGHALLLFPTASGDFLEAERMWLIKSIEHYLFEGKVQLWAIESINKHAWMNHGLSTHQKAHNTAAYSHYIENEVVPHIRRCMQSDGARIGVTGASFGAFYAANSFFRRPDLFDTLVAMSGFYDLNSQGFLNGHHDDNVYFNNPLSYIPNMNDHGVLETIRHHSQVHILTGRGPWERPDFSEHLSHALHSKAIPHNLDIWGHDWPHDWPTWRHMLPSYIGHRLGW